MKKASLSVLLLVCMRLGACGSGGDVPRVVVPAFHPVGAPFVTDQDVPERDSAIFS